MPIYEYECKSCGHVTERLVGSLNEVEKPVCERCGSGRVERKFSTFGVGRSRSEPACPKRGSCTSGTCPYAQGSGG